MRRGFTELKILAVALGLTGSAVWARLDADDYGRYINSHDTSARIALTDTVDAKNQFANLATIYAALTDVMLAVYFVSRRQKQN